MWTTNLKSEQQQIKNKKKTKLIRTTNLKSKQKQQINNKEADLTQSQLHALDNGRKTSSGEEAAVHSETDLSWLISSDQAAVKRRQWTGIFLIFFVCVYNETKKVG